ncbi:MAG TPA: hypothetical protein VKC65_03090 [Gaiellaceae bacterium]|nr:hypothetical protein [Gaiellaceae bacterium]
MSGRSIPKLIATLAVAMVAVVSFVAPGASAPNGGQRASEWPLAVVVTKTDPHRPKAGAPFTALIGVFNQDTNDVVHAAQVACPARIGHRGLRMTRKAFIPDTGIAGCTWAIPAKAGGKSMVARVEVYSDEGTVRSRFLRVVRR